MEYLAGKTTITLIQGDITLCEVDALVNAANSRLQMGGGVAGAIRRAGGESIQAECDRIGGTPVGTAVMTGGGKLKARHVIHTVGPVMGMGNEDAKLEVATHSALALADKHGISSIALPAISSGIFGYPIERCARRMLSATISYLESGEHSLEKVVFCLFDDRAMLEFSSALEEIKKSRE